MRKLKNDYLDSLREITMNKKLILGLALAVVFVSGSVFTAHSETVIERDSSGNLNTPYPVPAGGGLG